LFEFYHLFDHNLNFKPSNQKWKLTFDIYISKPFQQYKKGSIWIRFCYLQFCFKHLKLSMILIRKSMTPKMGFDLGVFKTHLLCTFQDVLLVHILLHPINFNFKPKVKVTTKIHNLTISWIYGLPFGGLKIFC